ncbi:coiled-coil domain-containing protein [Lignipirellula cremea]|uniref:Chromosome partition protein Smc n=1 Tax=Lignipirellula cremea TaxID=2528010 RepID=A0A518DTV5_9BACT|nr:hypothetical protein [Lignipirellula cremea]QDU95271.1 Chromosome partition protein Smc [Lignipirellula cremea]
MSNSHPPESENPRADQPFDTSKAAERLQELQGQQPDTTQEMLELRRCHEALAADLRREIERMQADLLATQRTEEQVISALHSAQGARDRVREKTAAAARTHERLLELEQRYDSVQRHIVEARGELQQMQQLTDRLQTAEAKLQAAEAKCIAQVGETERVEKAYRAAIQNFTREAEQLHGKRRNHEAVVDLLQGALTSEQTHRAAAQHDLQLVMAQRDEALRSVEQEQARYAAAGKSHHETGVRMQAEADELRSLLVEAGEEVSRLQGAESDRQALAERLQGVVSQRDRLQAELQSMHGMFERTVEDYSAVQRQMSDENHALRALVDDLRFQNDTILTQAEQLQKSLLTVKEEQSQTRTRSETLEQETVKLRRLQADTQQALEAREHQHKKQTEQLQQRLQEEKKSLQSLVQSLRSQNETLQADNERIQQNVISATAERERTDSRTEEMETEIRQLQDQLDAARQNYGGREQQLKKDNARVQKAVDELLAKSQSDEAERVSWNAERQLHAETAAVRDRYRSQVEEQQARIISMEQQAQANEEAYWRQREEMHAEADTLRNEVQQMIRRQSATEEELRLARKSNDEFHIEQERGQKVLRRRMETLLEEAKKVCTRARRIQDEAQAEALALRKENEKLRLQLQPVAAPAVIVPPPAANRTEQRRLAAVESDSRDAGNAPKPLGMFSPVRQRPLIDENLPAWPQ